jgi:hypothetical protein
MESDTEAAKSEFVKYARPWLMKHPTPSMQALTPAEQRQVVRETVDRCLRKDGEPLRNYTDVWGTFGAWLSSVAEHTCATKYKTQPRAPVAETPQVFETKPAEPTAPIAKQEAGAGRTFFQKLRTPWIFLPILVIIAVVFVMGITSKKQPSGQYIDRSLPVNVILVGRSEARNTYFDVMPVSLVPVGKSPQDKLPETTIFRESRVVVLQLDRGISNDKMVPSRILFQNKSGETVWSTGIEAEALDGESFFLQLEPRTFPPDDYEILVVDAIGNAISKAAIMFR